MIVVDNIWKSFGDVEVLKGINLEVKKGEIVSICGASGAGKTTLLQIMGTLMGYDCGKVIIDGVETGKLSEKKLAKFRNQKIGFVFQFHNLLPEFTALENVCIPAFIGGVTQKKAIDRAKDLLKFLNLDHRLSNKPSQLSGGEKQRVAIARALINDPAIIFADEPSGNLDSRNTADLYELIFKMRAEYGQTFVIVTHNNELAVTTDRLLTIRDGVFS